MSFRSSARFVPAGLLLTLAACATAPGAAPDPEASVAAPAAPVYSRADIENASPDELNALFGPPALTRKEGAGEFRRYGLKTCSLIVILYPDDSGRRLARSITASALSSADPKPDLDACLAAG